MNPEDVDAFLSALLNEPSLPDDDVTLTRVLNDGAELSFHMSRQRDFLHVFYPLASVDGEVATGVVASGLFLNQTSAQGGMPALSYDPSSSQVMARTTLWLPALAGHQLAEALEESLQSCVAARQALSHQLASIHT